MRRKVTHMWDYNEAISIVPWTQALWINAMKCNFATLTQAVIGKLLFQILSPCRMTRDACDELTTADDISRCEHIFFIKVFSLQMIVSKENRCSQCVRRRIINAEVVLRWHWKKKLCYVINIKRSCDRIEKFSQSDSSLNKWQRQYGIN